MSLNDVRMQVPRQLNTRKENFASSTGSMPTVLLTSQQVAGTLNLADGEANTQQEKEQAVEFDAQWRAAATARAVHRRAREPVLLIQPPLGKSLSLSLSLSLSFFLSCGFASNSWWSRVGWHTYTCHIVGAGAPLKRGSIVFLTSVRVPPTVGTKVHIRSRTAVKWLNGEVVSISGICRVEIQSRIPMR